MLTLLKSLLFLLAMPGLTLASQTSGTIQNPYAWGENTGWVNFAPDNSNITVTDTTLTGYAWDPIFGWLNLSPTRAGVTNDGKGNLAGYAWSQGGGWVSFSGVRISSDGRFTGTASGETYGRLSFDCSTCHVSTDWRPASTRTGTRSSGTLLPSKPLVGLSGETSARQKTKQVNNEPTASAIQNLRNQRQPSAPKDPKGSSGVSSSTKFSATSNSLTSRSDWQSPSVWWRKISRPFTRASQVIRSFISSLFARLYSWVIGNW